MAAKPKPLGRLYFLGGPDELLRAEELLRLLTEVPIAPDDFDYQGFFGDEAKPSEWLNAVFTAPFMAERRVVVVRNVFRAGLDDIERVDWRIIPEFGLVILVGDEERNAEDRQKKLADSLGKIVKSAGGEVFSPKVDANAAEARIKARVQAERKSIQPSTVRLLWEMSGTHLTTALGEVEKAILYAGNSDTVRESDVLAVVIPDREFQIFNLVDAVVAGKARDVMEQLRVLTAKSGRLEEPIQTKILPMLYRQVRLMWQARLILDAGAEVRNLPPDLQRMLPKGQSLLTQSEWVQNRILGSARKVSMRTLQQWLEELNNFDLGMKTGHFSALELLEQTLLRMVEAVTVGATRVRA